MLRVIAAAHTGRAGSQNLSNSDAPASLAKSASLAET